MGLLTMRLTTNGSGHLGLESRIAVTIQSASIFNKPGDYLRVREGFRAVA